jgi:hypothetical protein
LGGAATDYLRVLGHVAFAYFWARMAHVALARASSGDAFYTSKLATARFYFARLLPEVEASFRCVSSGASTLFELDAEAF